MSAPRLRRSGAYTLIELMMVLVIVLIVLGLAMPNFQAMRERQRLRVAVNDLFGAISLTRSLAIARGSAVALAPSEPAGTAWERGWIVFSDDNANRRPDPGEERLFEQGPQEEGIVIVSHFTSGAAPHYIAYNSAGRSCKTGHSGVANFGTLTINLGQQQRMIKVNMLGRARVCNPETDPDCA